MDGNEDPDGGIGRVAATPPRHSREGGNPYGVKFPDYPALMGTACAGMTGKKVTEHSGSSLGKHGSSKAGLSLAAPWKDRRMTGFRTLAGSAVIAALLATSATPALARPGWGGNGWGGGGWGGGRHHDRHRGGGGNGLLAGVLILGGVAAIASAASASSRDRQQQRDDDSVPDAMPDDAQPVLEGPDDGGPEDRRSDEVRPDDRTPDDAAPDDRAQDRYRSPVRIENEEDAVDACAIAAEEDGGRDGRTAQVRDIDRVDAVGSGWNVSGRVELRQGYRDPDRQTEDFTCTVRDGQVASVRLTGGEGLR